MAGERTRQQRSGDRAEALVAAHLERAGWRILGRNVRVGRSELDLVAVDPGPPARLVVVEVRWRASRAFGLAEETFDRAKRAALRAGLGRLLEARRLPSGEALPALPVAVDLVVVEPGPLGGAVLRHHRDALGG